MYTVSLYSERTLSCCPDKPRQHTKKQRHYFANIGPFSQRYGFSSSQVWMWELDLKEGWAHKNWCFCGLWCGEDSWESLDCKEIQPVNPKGNKSWIFIGRTDAEVEAPNFGHRIQRADSLEKTLILGNIEGRRRGQEKTRWFDDIIDSMDMNLSKFWEMVKDREPWCAAVHGVAKSRIQLSDWTTATTDVSQRPKVQVVTEHKY